MPLLYTCPIDPGPTLLETVKASHRLCSLMVRSKTFMIHTSMRLAWTISIASLLLIIAVASLLWYQHAAVIVLTMSPVFC